MPNLTHVIQRILELMKRYPGVIALGGFISGVGSFILVDRQQGMASWIAVIMLVSWLWLMGCIEGQGYWFARPMSGQGLLHWLQNVKQALSL